MPVFDRDRLPWEGRTLETRGGPVQVRWYVPSAANAAVAFVGGVGGGFDTPGRDLYPRLAEDLAAAGVGSLRVRFRDPRSLPEATSDLCAGIDALQSSASIAQLAVVGHSFGGAVVIRAALARPSVVAVVTLATQSAGTDRVGDLARPLLLIHGDEDLVLPWQASAAVARRAGDVADLRILHGAGHGLSEHQVPLRALLGDWLIKTLADAAG